VKQWYRASATRVFPRNPKGQSFERLQQTKTIVCIRRTDLHLADFLSQPCASFANCAFLSPQFVDHITKRFLVGTDFRAQITKELPEGISLMISDQLIEQFQSRDGTGEMIVQISVEVIGGFGMGHNAVSNFPPERVAFRRMFAAVQSASKMLERA